MGHHYRWIGCNVEYHVLSGADGPQGFCLACRTWRILPPATLDGDGVVGERIYALTEERALEAMEERSFSTEDELQALIAEHPELLDGEQISPGDARRWILVSREKGIAESSGAAARWAVDLLIIGQDAVPTLVELKRGSNPEIRRTIIGQLLEYAAHASETWTAQDLRALFDSHAKARGADPRDEIEKLLESDVIDAEQFWTNVATNLAAKRLRLLFVADHIPDPLARVVAFLNEQMSNVEVLAVEIKRFTGKSGETLVPRVIGRLSAHTARRRRTRESTLDGFDDTKVRGVAERLLDVAEQSGAVVDYYGQGNGLSIRAQCPEWSAPISVAWLYPRNKPGYMRTRDFSFGAEAVFEPELPQDVRAVLEAWVGQFSPMDFAEDVSSKGVKAWAVSHDRVVECQDLLVEGLRDVLSKLASL